MKPLGQDGVDGEMGLPNQPSKFSHVPLYVEIRNLDKRLACGTGFLVKHKNLLYFVTASHIVTGRNETTKENLDREGVCPTALDITIKTEIAVNDLETFEGQNGETFVRANDQSFPKQLAEKYGGIYTRDTEVTLELYKDSNFYEPAWLVHPTHGLDVDVSIIPINQKLPDNLINVDILHENLQLFPNAHMEPGMDVFILGYPSGLFGGSTTLPIWKRGSIASEPSDTVNALPQIYIDTATRPGMSGSPVYAQWTGLNTSSLLNAGRGLYRNGRRFLGIYSGRAGTDPLGAQLGIVWKESVISEIIDGGVRGDSMF